MVFYISETLKSADLPDDLKPHLVYGEVMEGARKPLVFRYTVREDFSLVGRTGTKISVPKSTQLSASSASESTIESSGFSPADVTMTDTDISIGNIIYAAVRLTDVLLEDQQDIAWVRLMLKNMGLAIAEYLDAAIRDCLIAGAGGTTSAATTGTLAYGDIIGAVRDMKKLHWFPEAGSPFLLFVPPACETDVLSNTDFYEAARYTVGGIDRIADEEAGMFGGCRVFVTSGFSTPDPSGAPELALVVAPPTHTFGPSTILAWKRRLKVKSDREEVYERTFYVTSVRYGVTVVNSSAIRLISNC